MLRRSWLLAHAAPLFDFRFPGISTCAVFLFLAGCASPGEPIERKAPVPEPVKDLAAAQSGNDVILTFTLPTEAIDHRQLVQTPTVEIYRDFPPTAAAGASASSGGLGPALLVTIPASVVDQYTSDGSVRYSDSLKADDFAQHPNAAVEYMVRTRESEKKSSPDSNLARLRVYPAPLPIDDVKTAFDRICRESHLDAAAKNSHRRYAPDRDVIASIVARSKAGSEPAANAGPTRI